MSVFSNIFMVMMKQDIQTSVLIYDKQFMCAQR